MNGKIFIQKTDYWIIEREVAGFNGGGGFWIVEKWKWPSGGTCWEEIRTLTLEQSRKLEKTGTL